MSKIWITSDLHFGHDRQFIYGPRGFSSIKEHDDAIVERWNSIVEPGDTVYILGDLCLGDNQHGIELIKKLNGFKHVILGNHCTETRAALYREYCISVQHATVIKYGKWHFYLSHYPTLVGGEYNMKDKLWCLCGHCHYTDKFADMDKKCYHVEVDAHNCYPVSIDAIIEDINNYKGEQHD